MGWGGVVGGVGDEKVYTEHVYVETYCQAFTAWTFFGDVIQQPMQIPSTGLRHPSFNHCHI